MNCNISLLLYAIENADGWVVRSLKDNFNSVFPAELITEDDTVQLWEKMLSCIVKSKVNIRKTEGGYICER